MAVGFTPKHIEDVSLNGLTEKQFIAVAYEAAKRLKWEVGYVSSSGFIAYTNNGMFSWNGEIKINVEFGTASLKSSSTGGEIMDWGKNKKAIQQFVSTIDELRQSITKEELENKYKELMTTAVDPGGEDILKRPAPTASEGGTGFFSFFIPREGFFITPILLNLNILIFIIMAVTGVSIMLPDTESLLNWGANFRPLTLEGEWWRLLTCCFLHIGIIHLLMNMYALMYIGVLLEPMLDRSRFLSAYLLAGISASVVSLWWHDLTVSAGASGAIFGMYGVFLAMLTTNLIEKAARKPLLTSIGVFVLYNLVYGMKGGIDNAAHIGGLVSGLIIGYAFVPGLKKVDSSKSKFSIIGILTAVILVATFSIYKSLPNDIGKYEEEMKKFVSMEDMAMGIYKLPEDAPKETILSEIKDRGIYYWNENIKLLNSFDQLDLPVEIRMRNDKLRNYCEQRIKTYNLIYKAVDEETSRYDQAISSYNKEIEAIINELSDEKN